TAESSANGTVIQSGKSGGFPLNAVTLLWRNGQLSRYPLAALPLPDVYRASGSRPLRLQLEPDGRLWLVGPEDPFPMPIGWPKAGGWPVTPEHIGAGFLISP